MVAAGSWWFAGRAAIVICSQGAQLVRGGDGAAIVICSQGAQCVRVGDGFDLPSRCAVRVRWRVV